MPFQHPSVQELLQLFPYPNFRPYQKGTLTAIAEAYNSGIKSVILRAPVGAGKSAVNTAPCRFYKSFYSTPQLSLIKQILADRYIGRYYTEIKGQGNYRCVKSNDPTDTVRHGMCKRVKGYLPDYCDKFNECPYWKAKRAAIESRTVLTSTAYLMLEGLNHEDDVEPPFLSSRELQVIDEGHNLDELILGFVSIVLSPNTLHDIYYNFQDRFVGIETMKEEDMKSLLTEVLYEVDKRIQELEDAQTTLGGEIASKDAVEEQEHLTALARSIDNILYPEDEVEWVWYTTYVKKQGKDLPVFTAQPLSARHYGHKFIWKRSQLSLISSATVDPDSFIWETGLDKDITREEIRVIDVPSTFSVVNRPIIDWSWKVGSMSKANQDANIDKAVEAIAEVAMKHKGQNVAVHCPSYKLAKRIFDLYTLRFRTHPQMVLAEGELKTQIVEDWTKGRGKVLLAVGLAEGQDWKDDICRAQILVKTLYPDLSDKRVAKRVKEKGDWRWYNTVTMNKVIQAYGRGVRSESDYCTFYILDDTFFTCYRQVQRSVPDWFSEVANPVYEEFKRRLGR